MQRYRHRYRFLTAFGLLALLLWLPAAHANLDGTCGVDTNTAYNSHSGFFNAPQYPILQAFAALKADGSITAWGDGLYGGSGAPTGSGYVSITSTQSAFAALKADGSITAWGFSASGGSGAPTGSGYVSIASNSQAFAALKADGSITAWGHTAYGGSGAPTGSGYVSIASTTIAFAALKADGSITAWGEPSGGGSGAPTGSGYVSIASTYGAFAALKADGSITAWGNGGYGGSSAPSGSGYVSIAAGFYVFAALKADGSITVWGDPSYGGSGAPSGSGYVSIASTHGAFAALKADGSITAWGNTNYGGSGAPSGSGYVSIASNAQAFAALKADGSITVWGYASGGGSGAPTGSGYVSIASTGGAFAALKADGSITAWGTSTNGGSSAPTGSGYVSIASNNYAFAALKADGSITAWGSSALGGSGAPTGSGYVSINGVSTACFNALSPLTSVPTLTLAATAATVAEGNSGTTAYTFTVTRAVNTAGATTVDWAVTGSGASPANAADFGGTLPSGTVSFAAGDTSKVISVLVTGDSSVEPDETFSVTLTNPSGGATLLTATATGTIQNDDTPSPPNNLTGSCGVDTNRAYNASPRGYFGKPYRENWGTFAALKADGSIKEWGQYVNNPTYNYQEAPTDSGYISLVSNVDAFAALKADGSIKAWGTPSHGGSGAPTDSGYVRLFSNYYAFVAMKADGSIKAWGDSSSGSGGAPTDNGYVSLAATQGAFAALKADGSIRSWGANIGMGGTYNPPTDNGYVSIWSSSANFYAMKADGSLRWWGGYNMGAPPAGTGYVSVTEDTSFNFAALKADGSITTWGQFVNNGAYPSYQNGPTDSGYVSIAATKAAFAALKADGSIKAWGFSGNGAGGPTDNGYISITANASAFAALKADGSITAWGNSGDGGTGAPTDSGYVSIAASNSAFAALKADGSITAWGNSGVGGAGEPTDSGYVSIMSTTHAFAALKADGSITTWGSSTYGGAGGPTDSGYVSINGVTTDCFNALSPLTTAPTLTLAASAATLAEGNSGTTAYTFTVTRAVNTAGATSVDWAVTGSGASPADATDFGGTLPSGTVSFAAGETSKVISVLVTGDSSVEPDETFSVTLTNPSSGATLLTATATGTIQNEDTQPPLSVQTPPAQTATTGQVKTGNAATELNPTGGVAPYDYSNGSADPACSAPVGATLLPVGSSLGVTSSTGVYSYTAPSSAGTYYYCIAVSDSTAPTAQRVVTAYTLTVTPSAPEKVLEYSIRRSLDGRYHVYMRPTTTTPSNNNSLTGQITLKVPSLSGANRFVVADVVNPLTPVEWSQTSRVDAPSENTAADYLSFTFSPYGTPLFTWQAGVELEVFSFINANAQGCSGMVSVMEDTDPFNQQPNSVNSVPSNQFTNLGWGSPTDNNYLGIYGSAVDCSSTNQPPVITSNGGGDSATLTHPAGSTTVTTVTATDADNDTLTYSLSGGADAAKFTIDSSTGVLTFLTAPQYGGNTGEIFTPAGDSDGNNIYEVTVQVSDGKGGTDTQQLSITLTPSNLTLTLSVWLQGPYDSSTGLMNDDLRLLSLIPSAQPYTVAPFAYQGTETVDSGLLALTGSTALVDWVLVELRQGANPATVVARQAALVRRDGSVVNSSGSTALSFNGVNNGIYHVGVRHRNHLGIMTTTPVTLSTVNTVIDFKTASLVTQGTHSRLVSGGQALLWAGDVNKSNYIIANGPSNDVNDLLGSVLLAPQNQGLNGNYRLLGYYAGDVNLDGSTLFAGPGNDTNLLVGNVLLHPSNSTFSGNYVIGGGAAAFTPEP